MERKVLKWMTIILGALTIVTCLGLGIIPMIKDSMQTSSNKKPTQQTENVGNTQSSEQESEQNSETESEKVPEIQAML